MASVYTTLDQIVHLIPHGVLFTGAVLSCLQFTCNLGFRAALAIPAAEQPQPIFLTTKNTKSTNNPAAIPRLKRVCIPATTITMRNITPETLSSAVRILCSGGVVIIPTDTVYGIAAHPDSERAVSRICTIKGRPAGKPIALLAADPESVTAFGAEVPAKARKLMESFWPGALTLVLPCGQSSEGFRVPAHDQIRRVIKACGGTLRVTSANLSGAMPARSAVEALQEIGVEADMVIDGGICPGGVASTVVKVDADNTLTILREGAISAAQIHALL